MCQVSLLDTLTVGCYLSHTTPSRPRPVHWGLWLSGNPFLRLFTSGGLVLVSVLLVFVMVGWRDGVLGWWHCCCGNGCGMLSTCPVRRFVVHCAVLMFLV